VAESHPQQRGGRAEYISENPVVLFQDGNTSHCPGHSKDRKSSIGNGSQNRNEAKYNHPGSRQFNAQLNTSGGGIAASDVTGEVKGGHQRR